MYPPLKAYTSISRLKGAIDNVYSVAKAESTLIRVPLAINEKPDAVPEVVVPLVVPEVVEDDVVVPLVVVPEVEVEVDESYLHETIAAVIATTNAIE